MSKADETKNSIKRIQDFDVNTLERKEDLGKSFAFSEAVEPAKTVIALFKQLPVNVIDELPESNQQNLINSANTFYNIIEEVLKFDSTQADATNKRQSLINNIKNQYSTVFNNIHPFVSYGVSRTVDFTKLENDARSAVQSVKDQTGDITKKLEEYEDQARKTLDEIRKVAAEQGVSQQAIYFKDETKIHDDEAKTWKKYVIILSVLISFYGIITLFMHKWSWIAPTNNYESMQFITSKIVVFFVLVYLLTLSARNFLSHRHNAVVNRHRQNSLMTFTALVKASGTEETRDIILNHAASCIFSQQDTGYIKSHSNSAEISGKTIIETVPKLSKMM
jgi:hypothetical protein